MFYWKQPFLTAKLLVSCDILPFAARKPSWRSSSCNWLAAKEWDWQGQYGFAHPNGTSTDGQPGWHDAGANDESCATKSMHWNTCFCTYFTIKLLMINLFLNQVLSIDRKWNRRIVLVWSTQVQIQPNYFRPIIFREGHTASCWPDNPDSKNKLQSFM